MYGVRAVLVQRPELRALDTRHAGAWVWGGGLGSQGAVLLLRGAALRWLRLPLPLPLPQCAPAHFVSLVRRWARHRHWVDGICQRTDADGTGDGEDGEAAATPLVVVSSGRQVHVLPQQSGGANALGWGGTGWGCYAHTRTPIRPPASASASASAAALAGRWPPAAGRWNLLALHRGRVCPVVSPGARALHPPACLRAHTPPTAVTIHHSPLAIAAPRQRCPPSIHRPSLDGTSPGPVLRAPRQGGDWSCCPGGCLPLPLPLPLPLRTQLDLCRPLARSVAQATDTIPILNMVENVRPQFPRMCNRSRGTWHDTRRRTCGERGGIQASICSSPATEHSLSTYEACSCSPVSFPLAPSAPPLPGKVGKVTVYLAPAESRHDSSQSGRSWGAALCALHVAGVVSCSAGLIGSPAPEQPLALGPLIALTSSHPKGKQIIRPTHVVFVAQAGAAANLDLAAIAGKEQSRPSSAGWRLVVLFPGWGIRHFSPLTARTQADVRRHRGTKPLPVPPPVGGGFAARQHIVQPPGSRCACPRDGPPTPGRVRSPRRAPGTAIHLEACRVEGVRPVPVAPPGLI
ncbi:hypothetical protein Purlil1_8185 [Purpureocillium lilacinum]|uniref:Uncharacterized protein n=1 Tax=Purpureocillium lilacinum TaxID=33203 RepID=A0ABR0BU98_PURLI|nr:hypothetical protein Purlil1_8185 [Purpureocillium lilacinum]